MFCSTSFCMLTSLMSIVQLLDCIVYSATVLRKKIFHMLLNIFLVIYVLSIYLIHTRLHRTQYLTLSWTWIRPSSLNDISLEDFHIIEAWLSDVNIVLLQWCDCAMTFVDIFGIGKKPGVLFTNVVATTIWPIHESVHKKEAYRTYATTNKAIKTSLFTISLQLYTVFCL